MKLLVDTHALLWIVDQPGNLGGAARAAIQDPANELLLSNASIWEIAIKVGLKKLALSVPFREWVTRAIADLGLSVLNTTIDHADVQMRLAFHHRDPFDRLLVAQAMVEHATVVTADALFDAYGISRIWD